MEGIGAAHAGQPTAKDRLADKRVFMVRSFDFHQDARITQAILRFPYVLFISDLLQGRIRSNALGAIHHEVKSESTSPNRRPSIHDARPSPSSPTHQSVILNAVKDLRLPLRD
jgi:hypothetical protein